MRELKFRAWFKEEARMINWNELHLETDENGLFVWIGETDNFGTVSRYPLEDFVLIKIKTCLRKRFVYLIPSR